MTPPQKIDFNFKRILDPVHGPIGLSELEALIINEAKAFNRLRSVKQLGLAHFVFAGADYSRFSHSIGVCHITGRILEALRDSGVAIADREVQLYRLAGLLHDLGHYPFSHAMEIALQNEFADRNVIAKKTQGADLPQTNNLEEPPFEHEHLGKQILDNDEELKGILAGVEPRIEPREIHEIFTKVNPPRFANIISSDLDADRIDYLLRNSYHTGLPYGEVDISHIIGQMRVDDKDRICLTHKALRSADHLFLGRFFDYQQIPFNKTVVALEAALKDVIGELVREKRIDGSREAIAARIVDRSWCNFDDGLVLEKIRELHDETEDDILRTKTKSILYRTPAKLVGEVEYIAYLADDEYNAKRTFRQDLNTINKEIETWAGKFGIDKSLWYVWTKAGLRLTKDGSRRPLPDEDGDDPGGDRGGSQLIRIGAAGGKSIPIVNLKNSLMRVISNYGFFALRIYVLFPEGQESQRRAITEQIIRDQPEFPWKRPGSMFPEDTMVPSPTSD